VNKAPTTRNVGNRLRTSPGAEATLGPRFPWGVGKARLAARLLFATSVASGVVVVCC